jgi:hypothetical protein
MGNVHDAEGLMEGQKGRRRDLSEEAHHGASLRLAGCAWTGPFPRPLVLGTPLRREIAIEIDTATICSSSLLVAIGVHRGD